MARGAHPLNGSVMRDAPGRLERLRHAKEYRTEDQVILDVDTRALVVRHGPRIELCRLNVGAITE